MRSIVTRTVAVKFSSIFDPSNIDEWNFNGKRQVFLNLRFNINDLKEIIKYINDLR